MPDFVLQAAKDGVAYNKMRYDHRPVGDIAGKCQFSFIVWHDKDKLDKKRQVFELNVTIRLIQPFCLFAR